jgi:hypothetical protein
MLISTFSFQLSTAIEKTKQINVDALIVLVKPIDK